MVKMDRFGRILLPAQIRKSIETEKFTISYANREIVLKPVPSWDELAGSCPKIDMDAYWKEKQKEKEKERKDDAYWIRRLSTRVAGSRSSKGKRRPKRS